MYKRKKDKQKKVIIISVITILVAMGLLVNFLIPNRNLSTVEKTIKDSVLFVESVLYKPFKYIGNLISHKEKQSDYDKLLEDSKKLSSVQAERDEYKLELEEMRKLLELNSALSDKMYLSASVINRNVGYWDDTITIDKGESSGIEPNMAVVEPGGGLIGTVTKVSNFNSTVKLLTGADTNNKLSVKINIGEDFVYGLLVGYENDEYLIEGISLNILIPEGSLVTTTSMGENVPAGILIGKVSGVTTDNFDLAKVVKVKSDIDFNNISYVTVLKRGKEQ